MAIRRFLIPAAAVVAAVLALSVGLSMLLSNKPASEDVLQGVKVLGVALEPYLLKVQPGETAVFDYLVHYEDESGKRGSKKVGNKRFRAEKPGTFSVVQEYEGQSGSAVVVVLGRKPAARMWIMPPEVSVGVGQQVAFDVWVEYLDGTEEKVETKQFSGAAPMKTAVFAYYENLSAQAEVVVGETSDGTSVPSVLGLSAKDARRVLNEAGLKAVLQGGDPAPRESLRYTIQSQQPEAGRQVTRKGAVVLRVYDESLSGS